MKKTIICLKLLIISCFFGCVIPESNHVEPEYHLLTAKNFDTNNSSIIPGISFHVREVNLPPYLDDNRLVQRKKISSINYLENHRWGEPLGEGVSRVIGLNLSNMLGTFAFSSYPNRSRQGVVYEISISLLKFERFDAENVRVEAVIEIFHKNHLQVQLKVQEVVPIQGRATSAEVQALSVCLFKVSTLITKSLNQLPLSQSLMIKIEEFEIENSSLAEVVNELSDLFESRSQLTYEKNKVISVAGDFDFIEQPAISVKIRNTTFYELIKIISQKSGFLLKFYSTGIVFNSLP